tara:strand:+ start:578 stop:1168 length:591 start_codon:yes stop_codon:yes gene_type:complete
MSKKSFILHLDSLDVIDELNDQQVAELFKAIIDYQKTGKTNLKGLMKVVFIPFKNQFLRDQNKYDTKCETNRINGSKGGRPKKTKDNPDKPKITQRLNGKPNKPYNDSDSDNDSKNDSVSDNKNDNKNDSVNKAEILKMTGKTVEEVLQSDYSIEDKHKILTIRMMRQSNYDLSNSDLYTSCFKTVKKRYLNTELL